MTCPRCDAEVEGKFCGMCGAPLVKRACPSCSASVPPGHRFCAECGAEQAGASAASPAAVVEASGTPSPAPPPEPDRPDRRGWWIAAAAVVGGALFLAVPYVWSDWADQGNAERIPMGAPMGQQQAPGQPAPGQQPPPGMTSDLDLSTMTPREAADRLFNRVMVALGEGDQQEIEMFLPMAIDAYELVPDLDADGHFHLSLLQHAAGEYQAALNTAERVLASDPDHLLALHAAGEAAREMGDQDRAREHFQHALDVFDDEVERDLPEYREHESLLAIIQETARDFLATDGS